MRSAWKHIRLQVLSFVSSSGEGGVEAQTASYPVASSSTQNGFADPFPRAWRRFCSTKSSRLLAIYTSRAQIVGCFALQAARSSVIARTSVMSSISLCARLEEPPNHYQLEPRSEHANLCLGRWRIVSLAMHSVVFVPREVFSNHSST